MHQLRHFILLLLISISSCFAGDLAQPVRAEISTLLEQLESSNCQFMRNNSWYSASQAKAHLLSKLDYFVEKNAIHSTEEFIQKAASKSSVSGNSYQVRCGVSSPQESAVWLGKELEKIRASKSIGKIPPTHK